MQAKNIICFEFEKEERVYRLQMPMGAPLGEAYEAASSFKDEMVRLINEHAKEDKPKEKASEAESEQDQSQEEA